MTTTEVTNPVRDVELALAELNAAFNSQLKFGATDTEPEGVLHLVLHSVMDGRGFALPMGVTDWQLYDVPGAADSANKLTQAMTDFITMYGDLRATCLEWDAIRDHVSEYAWRISK